MQLGMFMQPMHDPEKEWLLALREDQEAVVLGDELGFSECWIGEHFTSKPEQITSPLIFLATLIEKTKRIKLGTGVINLPNHHPAQIAGYAAMFDQLCEGRFLFGIGVGGLASDFELFGQGDPAARTKMSAESISTILKIWESDPPYEIDGANWPVSVKDVVFPELGVGMMGKPYQKPHPPIAMSVASERSGSAKLCGMKGWIPISASFVQPRIVPSHWEAYAEGAEKAGIKPDRSVWRVGRSMLVTESDQEAADYMADETTGVHFYWKYLLTLLKYRNAVGNYKDHPDMGDDEVTVPYILDTMMMAGSPKTVLDRLVAFHDMTGYFGTLIMTCHDWDNPPFWKRSMRLLAEEVLPKFTQHAEASRQAAE